MATSQTTPTPETPEVPKLQTTRYVFDLDTKETVKLVKQGEFAKVSTVDEFVSRLGNDANTILQVINDGLMKFEESKLASDESKPWLLEDEDDETGAVTLTEYKGTPISEEKGRQLSATVINIAKLMFGYSKKMDENVEENRKKKAAAKAQALTMILSNPASVEVLKSAK
jgi:hypothetical protein